MFWPHWKYEEYVEKHVGWADSVELLDPDSERLDENVRNVHVTFYSMPDWMDWYDLTLDDSAFKIFHHRYRAEMKDYKAKLRRQFAPITGLSVGKALLKELGSVHRVVKFRPNWNWGDPLNADTEPRSVAHPENADWIHSMAKGERFYFHHKRRVGAGGGANSIIRYTPEMWGPGGAAKSKAPGDDPDEIIFHELIHASRQMRGVQENKKVDRGYDDVEEYLAVVISNIYMSEKGKTVLLGDHGDATLRHPEKFLDNVQHVDVTPRQLLLNFKTAQPDFFRDLANIGRGVAAFNPVRQFDEELKAGRALADVMLGAGR
ncbi:conserved hypothetical protein [Methylocella tundrae]|uniref:Uncharacterized protein n=1 Tax=Methylocella tundrae TaxID=227605 RepID=A0A8B6MAK3_METTU|nr:M91 family zinc metallopeptidase [Methylocella tundrae]VTZ27315.1 conserved hypothetical protein [Methylocella tundrae]VTZ51094.1 conserved hypothetical protein [Methylocella tundrae]